MGVSATLNSAHQSACGISSRIRCQSCRRWKYGSSIRAAWVMNRISPSSAVCFRCSMMSAITRSLVSPWIARNLTSGVRLARSFSGLRDQENARLDEENLLAQSSQTMGVAHGGIRLRAAAQAIYIMNNQMSYTPVQKKSPHGLADTSRAFSTGVLLVGLGLNCRSHDDCATLKSMASARSRSNYCIYTRSDRQKSNILCHEFTSL